MTQKYIVIFREHNKLLIDTLYVGPFDTFEEAYESLCEMPALGTYEPSTESVNGSGVKYIETVYTSFEEAKSRRIPFDDNKVELLSEIELLPTQN
jgi:hypothetical protein